MHTITHRIESISELPIIKTIFAAILTAFTPVLAALVSLLLLVFIDLVLGIYRGIVSHSFTSARLRTGVSKFILYPIAIVSVRLAETQIPMLGNSEVTFVSSFMILYLSVTELISILETLTMLKVPIPKSLKEFFEKQLSKKLVDRT